MQHFAINSRYKSCFDSKVFVAMLATTFMKHMSFLIKN
jgi:hypothetical protein